MDDERAIAESLAQTGFDFLLVELDIATTMLDSASLARSVETRLRQYQNARKAYDTVLHMRPKVRLNEEQRQEIEAKLAAVKARLEDARC